MAANLHRQPVEQCLLVGRGEYRIADIVADQFHIFCLPGAHMLAGAKDIVDLPLVERDHSFGFLHADALASQNQVENGHCPTPAECYVTIRSSFRFFRFDHETQGPVT